jgi:RecJ-like exonuclease
MPEPIVFCGDDETEIRIPSRFEVCDRCRGEGTHDCFEGGMTTSEMHEQGGEFIEDYFAGHYSVPCTECKGKRVVAVIDERRATPEQLAAYETHLDDMYEDRAMAAAERAAGC